MDIPKILDTLIDGWCERRAIRPLKYLLRAYPGPLAHTDQLYELLDALKDVKDLCRDDLTPEERQMLNKADNTLEDSLGTR
ncbi:MAG: hypothetical protein DME66_01525 [Verrucomicrobia bacterium]|nr:MAG: hypothetical protein DME66_01525 [Verrucomicrobiota bacterium]